jgi:hypothetical protein
MIMNSLTHLTEATATYNIISLEEHFFIIATIATVRR